MDSYSDAVKALGLLHKLFPTATLFRVGEVEVRLAPPGGGRSEVLDLESDDRLTPEQQAEKDLFWSSGWDVQ